MLACLASGRSYGQDFSNKGKDFWVIYTGHIDGTGSRMALYITSDQNATGTVSVAGSSVPFTVTANQVTTVRLTNTSTPSNTLAYNGQTTGIGSNRGIHVVADHPVVVYAHILNSARSGSTLVLPTKVLGREYYVSTYGAAHQTNSNVRRTEFAVVATQDNTTIEITPMVADAGNANPALIPFQVTLNTGDVYQFQSADEKDLTGSYIKSVATATSPCKPIAVFAGSTWTAMGCSGASSGDNLYQQLMPLASWGKSYITAPFASRAYDVFRILVRDTSTVVQVNGNTLNRSTLINKSYYEFNTQGNNTARIITADQPVCVVQYLITQNCDGVNSDPEMIILNSVEQTLRDITVLSARNDLTPPNTNINRHLLNIIVRTSALNSLKIDGNPYSATPVVIPNTGYSYIQEDLTAATSNNPAHHIVCDSGFLAIAYGYGNVESYGYNAGTNVKDLYQFITIQNQYATVDYAASCRNTPFFFSMVFPYQPTQLTWDFNGLFPSVTLDNPLYDSTWTVNGRQLYRYKLPTPYSVPLAGTYPIRVLAHNPTPDGCSGEQEIEFELKVYDPPQAGFSFVSDGCASTAVAFTDQSSTGDRAVIHRYWDFGDNSVSAQNNPTHLFSTGGDFTVKYSLITDVGCLSDTIAHLVPLNVQPVAAFEVTAPYCQNKPVRFTDASTTTGGATIQRWYWDYGDGNRDTLSAPADRIHFYAVPGVYTATLRVQTTTGCFGNPASKSFTVSVNPVAGFSFPNICLPAGTAAFTNTTMISDGTQGQISYSWNFGDGSPPGTGVNPVHQYTGTGPYPATLIATSVNGCVDSITRSVNTIYAQAQSDFTVNPENCLLDTTRFVAADDPLAGNTIASWHWDFGDGTTAAIANPSHLYQTAGSFTVRHWIVTDKGCPGDTASYPVTVNPLPTAAFAFSAPVCETREIGFTDQSAPNAGILNSWTWNFGDGSAGATLQSPLHVFETAGNFPISLAVTSTKGCRSPADTQWVFVHPQPRPGFISPEVCLTDAFAQFVDTSRVSLGSINAWQWNFGDPGSGVQNNSSQQNPTHAYHAIGDYTATLVVTTDAGCVDTLQQHFTVNGDIPVANFAVLQPTSLCANDSVSIADQATVNFGNITRIEICWDAAGNPGVWEADEVPAPGKIYQHLYPNFQTPLVKTYSVTYRVYSGLSCVNETTRQLTVHAAPSVQFLAISDACLDATPFQVTQASETGGVPGTGVFSGPGISAAGIFNPASVGPGIYPIQYLFTATTAGCADSMTAMIKVLRPPEADFAVANPACETLDLLFTDHSGTPEGQLASWNWEFGDGTAPVIRNDATAFPHRYADWGDYTVRLRVITSNGCVSEPKLLPVRVHPLPRPNFSFSASACLPNANVNFLDVSAIADGTQSSFSYAWDFGDPASGTVNTSAARNPSHVYTSTGPYPVQLRVTSAAGCTHDTLIVVNTIHAQPLAAFAADKTETCLGGSFQFSDQSNPQDGSTIQWIWVFDDGTTASSPTVSHTYTEARSYAVSLVTINNFGCRSTTATTPVTVHPYPVVDAGPTRYVLEGGTVVLNPTVTGNDLAYAWTPDLYFAGPNNILNPVINGINDQLYTLTVTARGNCKSSDTVFVKVLRAPVIPNIFSPNGDGINDRWVISYLDTYPGCVIQIYNRYGQLVRRFVNYSAPWDGKINGADAPIGTYYYIIEPGNGRKPITGFVDIIR